MSYLDLLTSILNPHGFDDPQLMILEEEISEDAVDLSLEELRDVMAQLEFNKTLRKRVLSHKASASLKKIVYNDSSLWMFNTDCPIFLTDFEHGQELIQLPCNHCFIPEGIIKWLETEKAECPLCRKKLDVAEEQGRRRQRDPRR